MNVIEFLRTVLVLLCLSSGLGIIMPMTKTDGSLDVSSLLSHIALLEQTIENKASATELDQLKSDLAVSQKELAETKTQLTQVGTKLDKATDDLMKMEDTKTKLTQVETKLDAMTKRNSDQDQEIKELRADLKNSEIEIAVLKIQLGQQGNKSSPCASLTTDVSHLQSDVAHLKTEVSLFQSINNKTVAQSSMLGGSTFTRWGRTSCPADSKIVYEGYTGGTHYTDKASSASILCLPDKPIYANHTNTGHSDQISDIYGTEYEINYNGAPFEALAQEDMPCVVCETKAKSSVIMIPARNLCFFGWNLEYSGYLMGPNSRFASGEYICVDSDAEAIPGGQDDKSGQVLYPVESRCGPLPCPPYHDNWELTCVVCSK